MINKDFIPLSIKITKVYNIPQIIIFMATEPFTIFHHTITNNFISE
jgi:hypothetical protein